MIAVPPAAPDSSPAPTSGRRPPLPTLVAWLLAGLVYGLALTAAALWGLKTGERGLDSRALALLVCYALGGPLGLLTLAPLYRFLLPRRWPLVRFALGFILVAGASSAAIAFLAFVATNPIAEAFRPGIPMIIRVRSLVEPYALEGFLFLTIGQRVAMPQALVPLVLAAWWLADRRARR